MLFCFRLVALPCLWYAAREWPTGTSVTDTETISSLILLTVAGTLLIAAFVAKTHATAWKVIELIALLVAGLVFFTIASNETIQLAKHVLMVAIPGSVLLHDERLFGRLAAWYYKPAPEVDMSGTSELSTQKPSFLEEQLTGARL